MKRLNLFGVLHLRNIEVSFTFFQFFILYCPMSVELVMGWFLILKSFVNPSFLSFNGISFTELLYMTKCRFSIQRHQPCPTKHYYPIKFIVFYSCRFYFIPPRPGLQNILGFFFSVVPEKECFNPQLCSSLWLIQIQLNYLTDPLKEILKYI